MDRNTKIIIIILAVAVLGCMAFNFSLYESNKRYKNEITDLNYELDSLGEEIRFAEKLKIADEYLIKGDYETAMNQYNELISQRPDLDIMDIRKASFETHIEMNESMSSLEREGKSQINAIRKKMQSELMKVMIANKKSTDSLVNLYTGQLERLNQTLANKEKALKDKPELGRLIFYSKTGTRISYFGEIIGNKANGEGMGHYATGSLYNGSWKNNLKHGKGTYRWIDGEHYEGDYVNDKREGVGTYYWTNGERYEGEWKDDVRNGKGVLYDKDSRVKLQGEWKDGEFVINTTVQKLNR